MGERHLILRKASQASKQDAEAGNPSSLDDEATISVESDLPKPLLIGYPLIAGPIFNP